MAQDSTITIIEMAQALSVSSQKSFEKFDRIAAGTTCNSVPAGENLFFR